MILSDGARWKIALARDALEWKDEAEQEEQGVR